MEVNETGNAIEARGLRKEYKGLVALKGLDLTVKRGELFSLLGVNGAGKTTTIKLLTCLTRPTAGEALLLGKSITREPEAVKALIAVSPQETAVAPKLTVEENLRFMAGIAESTRLRQNRGETDRRDRSAGKDLLWGGDRSCHDKIEELCRKLGLEEVRRRPAGKLSGGWQRRLSIAMALILEPRILFLDEPTLGLDVLARAELWDLIRGLKGELTILLTTHYMEEAEALSDRIGILGAGRLLGLGTAAELKARPRTDSLEAAFIRMAKEGEK